jgi:hypothetical protein
MVTAVSTGVTACTVIVMLPVAVALPAVAWAVIVALPAATPVTKPVADTLATPGAELDHVTVALTLLPN